MSQNGKVEQLTLFSPDTWSGRMCPACSAAATRTAKISASSSKKPSALRTAPYLYLDLRMGYGTLLEPSWEIDSPSLGGYWTLNTGPAPLNGGGASSLSQILEARPHHKYYLSKTACLGILRRAHARGKELPSQLKRALLIQAGLAEPDQQPMELGAYHINQRDEGINLDGVSGALMATSNMQMQTFVTQAAGVVSKGNGDCFITPDVHTALTSGGGQAGQGYPCVLTAGFCAGAAPTAGNIGYQEECAPTLKAGKSGTNMVPSILCLNDQGGQRMDVLENQTGTLRACMDGHPPLVMAERQGRLDGEIYCIAGNAIDREAHNGGNGLGVQEGISYTITTTDHHAVYQQTVGALCRGDEKGVGNQYVSQGKCIVEKHSLIRRLTPLECERLMGFPDGWTDVAGGSDSVRYKALGNSVAIPCVTYVMRGIAYFFAKEVV